MGDRAQQWSEDPQYPQSLRRARPAACCEPRLCGPRNNPLRVLLEGVRVMRDYALSQAQATGSVGFSLATLFVNWQARRDVARLENCDDQTLRQIGLTREDVCQALRLPLTENSRLALDHYAFMRSRS